ncbi:hypothetical protein K7X08_022255 [Anisodus acutangulus]|uniref:Uncharacterized protein n=1 Tax=Anisodus acutangulus TaxID=402998 RepID=A0A9Q1MHI7_9SOLA|nr:hypothetical protein K7X08_022255 [Anisodus acutangulus]
MPYNALEMLLKLEMICCCTLKPWLLFHYKLVAAPFYENMLLPLSFRYYAWYFFANCYWFGMFVAATCDWYHIRGATELKRTLDKASSCCFVVVLIAMSCSFGVILVAISCCILAVNTSFLV